MARTTKRRFEPAPGMLICTDCKRVLPREAFLAVTVKDKRCKPGHSITVPSYDCRECRNERKRSGRREKAEASGGRYETRAEQRARKESQKLHRRVARAICLAFRALVRLSPEERIRRQVAQQRRRRQSDPGFWAYRKAMKIKRERAMESTQVELVSIHAVAERDGWCCWLCGRAVPRAPTAVRDQWSLDHVIPLSKGGHHTYDNVRLAHRGCNSRKSNKLPSSIAA